MPLTGEAEPERACALAWDARTTSVGVLAIRRFLRPVCYQDMPARLLPEALRDDNPLGVWRRVDGRLGH
ncbi:Ketoglutarate semialdehyde dehydrogenase [Rhodovastum atsumiense]|nr:Ketoglutarate semialdehyde dehydrogenase [Rhodovastum atsumiense]